MILLSLLGEQPIPNLLPLWQYPDYTAVQFAATRRTLPVAQTLTNAIARDPAIKRVEVLDPLILEAYNIAQARAALAGALANFLQAGRAVQLNLTGGTKLMSLAALQAAFGTGVPLLYVSTEEKIIIHYHSDGSEYQRDAIQVKISVAQYLQAHGLECGNSQSFNPNGPFSDIQPPKEGDKLEESVYLQACQSNLFDDVRRNLFVRRQTEQGQVVNELDVVATHNGRLVVCSCKSGKLTNDALYELTSLLRRELAGIYCGKVLVSGQIDLSKALRDRASADGVRLIYGSEVENAASHLFAALR